MKGKIMNGNVKQWTINKQIKQQSYRSAVTRDISMILIYIQQQENWTSAPTQMTAAISVLRVAKQLASQKQV